MNCDIPLKGRRLLCCEYNIQGAKDRTVFLLPEGVQIITKDDGVLFDISEDDVRVTSIASFAVTASMEKMGENRRHLTTMSFNRSSFLVKTVG